MKTFHDEYREHSFEFVKNFISPKTRESYLSDVEDFLHFSIELNMELKEFSELTERLFILFKRYLVDKKKYDNSSASRKLSSLSSFLKFLKQKNLVKVNPLEFVRRPKVKFESKSNFLTEDEAKLVLKYCFENCEDFKNSDEIRKYRSWRLKYSIIFVFLNLGLRVSELCNLKLSDYKKDGEKVFLKVKAKGHKDYTPRLNEKTIKVIDEYIKEFREKSEGDKPLFVGLYNTKKEGLNRTSLFKMIRACIFDAGIEKSISPHGLRGSVATILHKKGVSLKHIQDLLNHKHITTTTLYVKKSNEIEESASLVMDSLLKS